MADPFDVQELALLERYSSTAYLPELCAVWEQSLALPVCDLVQINFKATLDILREGAAQCEAGDMAGLASAASCLSDIHGQAAISTDSMPPDAALRYGSLLSRASAMASNITITDQADWDPGDLTQAYDAAVRGPLALPSPLPGYRRAALAAVPNGGRPARAGVYVPDVAGGCARFLNPCYDEAPQAKVCVGQQPLLHPDTGQVYGSEAVFAGFDCLWTMVERTLAAPAP